MTPTLDEAMKLADQDCPLPSLAGPALKLLRDRVRELEAATLRQPDSGRVGDEDKCCVHGCHCGCCRACKNGNYDPVKYATCDCAALAAQGHGEDEPVAWIIRQRNTHPTASVPWCTTHDGDAADHIARGDDVTPLYDHPAPAASPAGVPDGWKLVPVELTEEMRCAFWEAEDSGVTATWAATLAAAPSAPEGDGGAG